MPSVGKVVGVASAETCMTDTVTRAMNKKRERRQERRAAPPQLTNQKNKQMETFTPNEIDILIKRSPNVIVGKWDDCKSLINDNLNLFITCNPEKAKFLFMAMSIVGKWDDCKSFINYNLNLFITCNPEKAKFLFMAMSMAEVFGRLIILYECSSDSTEERYQKYLHLDSYIAYKKCHEFVQLLEMYLTQLADNERAIRCCIKKCVVGAILNVKRDARANASANFIQTCTAHQHEAIPHESMSEKELLRRERAARSRAAIAELNEQKNGAEIVWRDPVRLPTPVRVARCEKAKAASIHKVQEHEKFLKELELLRVEEEERKCEKRRIGKLIGGS